MCVGVCMLRKIRESDIDNKLLRRSILIKAPAKQKTRGSYTGLMEPSVLGILLLKPSKLSAVFPYTPGPTPQVLPAVPSWGLALCIWAVELPHLRWGFRALGFWV